MEYSLGVACRSLGQASVIWLLQATGETGNVVFTPGILGKTASFYFQREKRERVSGVSASSEWTPDASAPVCLLGHRVLFSAGGFFQMSENNAWPLCRPCCKSRVKIYCQASPSHLLEVRAPASPGLSLALGSCPTRAQGRSASSNRTLCVGLPEAPPCAGPGGSVSSPVTPTLPGLGLSREGCQSGQNLSSKSAAQEGEAGQGRGREGCQPLRSSCAGPRS